LVIFTHSLQHWWNEERKGEKEREREREKKNRISERTCFVRVVKGVTQTERNAWGLPEND